MIYHDKTEYELILHAPCRVEFLHFPSKIFDGKKIKLSFIAI